MYDKYKNICGIYKINFPNQKIYIGLSSNIQKRLIGHYKATDDLPVHRAIKKYGLKEEYISVLEHFDVIDRLQLQERECYWIKYYNSLQDGYNLTPGGDGAAEGVNNVSAKLSKNELNNLIKDLIENKIFIKDLSKKYQLSREAISDINMGKRYYDSNLNYPLRPNTKFTSEQMLGITGINKPCSKFDKEELEQIIKDLQENTKSLKTIAEEHNCSPITISHINTGKHYPNSNIKYPIRTKSKTTTKITQEELDNIIDLLKNTNFSYQKIGEKFGLSASAIGRINKGNTHKNDKISYPIRSK